MNIFQKILCALLTASIAFFYGISIAQADDNYQVVSEFRLDISGVTTARYYRMQIMGAYNDINSDNYKNVSGWLGVELPGYVQNVPPLIQVGLISTGSTIRWFFEEFIPGVTTCINTAPVQSSVHWTDNNGQPAGCMGESGNLQVGLNQWVMVQLSYDGSGYWNAQIYLNGTYYTVAKVQSSSTSIIRAYSSMEESFTVTQDPQLTALFYYAYPQYWDPSIGFKDWPVSATGETSLANQVYCWSASKQVTVCPSKYGFSANMFGSIRQWFSGTGGRTDQWRLFPLVSDNYVQDDMTSSYIDFRNYTRSYNWVFQPQGTFPLTWNQTVHWSNYNVSGDEDMATITFSGNNISRIYTMAYNRGTADIFLDGRIYETVYDYSPYISWQVVKTYDATVFNNNSGNHTLQIKAKSGVIDLDAFVANAGFAPSGTYDDTNSYIAFVGGIASNHWNRMTTPGPYNSTQTYSNTAQDAFRISFIGSGVYYYYAKWSNRGIAAITIDGTLVETLDEYSSQGAWQQNRYYSLGYGYHTLHVSVTGQKNSNSSNYYVDVDKVVVAP